MRIPLFLLPICIAVVQVTAAAADHPEAAALQERIVAHARTVTPDDYAYTRTVRTEQIEADKIEEEVLVERYDPAQPADQRWTLISINGKPPTAAALKNYRKGLAKRRIAYYGRIATYFAKPATAAVDARGRTIFRFASLPKDAVMVSDVDISANATGELVVDPSGSVPFVEEAHFTSSTPRRVKLVARIDSFDTRMRYQMMPNGKPVPVELVSEMRGSMLGREGRVRTRITFSDHRALR